MVPCVSLSSPHSLSAIHLFSQNLSISTVRFHHHFPKLRHPPLQPHRFTLNSLQDDASQSEASSFTPKSQLRTLFPGGYKRPEIKVPSIVLRLDADEVLGDKSVLDLVDSAIAKRVRVVVVSGGDGGGGKLYEAACLLKSVIRDRAYLLVAERVDIAAAVDASGVVLSDQGLPAIVARSTLMSSKSDSVILPVVGRSVETVNAALTASNSEGADFLICSSLVEQWSDLLMLSVNESVKIPIFFETSSIKNDLLSNKLSKFLISGVIGVVTTLEELKSIGDVLSKLLYETPTANKRITDEISKSNQLNMLNTTNGYAGEAGISSFVKLEDKEVQFIKKERRLLVEAVNAIEKAAPLMEEISLLNDAMSQLDEPFLLVIVGEFNSGKSTVINALLGGKFLKEGVVPTTNEITFLRYCDFDSTEQQRCETQPDGQYICYLSAQVLKKMVIVDTPGTNVILQRQQRLTEEFVPRADLLLFVLSADRPLSESEVTFLRYTQQWKKRVVFLLNKADLYRNSSELEEAIKFVSENVQKLLNVDHVTVFSVSARSALQAKLAASDIGTVQLDLSVSDTSSSTDSFEDFESFLYGFLDGSTSAGLERMKIKLETPIAIAERLLSSCQTLVTQDCRYAKKDLASVKELMGTVEQYALRMENESVSWRRQIFSLVESAKARVLNLVESTLQLSNLDLALSLVFKGDKSASIPATQSIQNDIVGPALSDALSSVMWIPIPFVPLLPLSFDN
ncbi:hypothetical protein Cgig2_008139 [Carnegiea gigantea]|uniref:FZO-like protein n=1 Tax=Carnegiea gigantea TaxID=171969 RepID=A0A9Q1QUZ9_9CARY|nr:hypothetical protein Cgig2_008139 [Carnegiea gigantea]